MELSLRGRNSSCAPSAPPRRLHTSCGASPAPSVVSVPPLRTDRMPAPLSTRNLLLIFSITDSVVSA